MKNHQYEDTICAISTPMSQGAIAIIRLSGKESLSIADKIFSTRSTNRQARKVYFGQLLDGQDILDDVLFTYYQSPHSFTGEDMVEISTHGSLYIQERLIALLIAKGCRLALPGEFTQRAFLNGKIDLSQAEAIADLIASQSKSSHQLAMNNLRGQVSKKIADLREKLLHFSALMELELDFSEEDVEFADRKQFAELLNEIEKELTTLLQSFQMGNAIKKGISVAIVGKPNVGKSTLLNALLKEDRAIVSDISGPTRDTIEDTIQLNGFLFRFVDTAGIRKNADTIEKMGIERSFDALNKAMAVLWVADQWSQTSLLEQYQELFAHVDMTNKKKFLLLNKIDTHANQNTDFTFLDFTTLPISAKNNININRLEEHLANYAQSCYSIHEVMISNLRHYHAFEKALHALQQAKEGFENGFSNDLIAVDIRQTLHFLAEVVGQVSNEDILSEIFSNFCIGK